MEPKRLYRSLTDRKIAGVAGGLAEYFDTDPLLLRLAFVVLALAVGGGVLIYFILWIVTPEKPINYGQFTSQPASGTNPGSESPGTSDPFKSQDPFNKQDPFKTADPPKSTNVDPFKETEKTKGSLIGGLVLITLGSLFLVNQLVPNIDFGDLWPILLVVIGGGLLINAFTGRK
ncbi:MAG: PspC domain-containing protein [Bacteroidetes bacterium]|nr:PspC domain-containing protein [Bacteroidota bacterium]